MYVYTTRADFNYNRRRYACYIVPAATRELRIHNLQDKTLIVKQGQRSGLLQIDGRSTREVDVTKPYFYNLIRAAVQALETEERNKVILEKDQLIAGQKQVIDGKNDQINALKQQIGILNQRLNQLTSEQKLQLQELQNSIQEQEAEVRKKEAKIQQLQTRIQDAVCVRNSSKIKEKLQSTLDASVWSQLSEASQQNLIAAVSNYEIAKQREFLKDYSEAVSRVSIVVEVEIISLFFNSFYTFLNERNSSRTGTYTIGGVWLRRGQDYTIGQLPRLIAQQFTRFNEALLTQEELSPQDRKNLYQVFQPREQLNERDRNLITQFLQQWNHPVGKWLRAGEPAASLLEQVRQIRNLASHLSSVYEWHFRQLLKLVVEERGLLRQIYWERSSQQSSEPTRINNPLRMVEIRRPHRTIRLR